jgi:hypothetical protein
MPSCNDQLLTMSWVAFLASLTLLANAVSAWVIIRTRRNDNGRAGS